MKYFSTFTGVGGIDMGLPIEWECVGFSEIDKFASQVLQYKYPNIYNYGNIKTINWATIPDFNLLVGGSPCQDLSIAGKRKGITGERSGLFTEFIRALQEKKPEYFIWENVAGALSSNNGWDFAEVQTQMVKSGYELWWQVLNAKNFGVPQNRKRIFVIGSRNGSPREVFFERGDSTEATRIHEEEQGERERLCSQSKERDGSDERLESRGGCKDDLVEITQGASQGYRVYDPQGLSVNIASQAGGLGAKTGLYAIPVLTPDRLKKRQNGRRFKEDGEEMFTITAQDKHGVFTGKRIRRLTPLECERLMSWPEKHTEYGRNEKGQVVLMSDNQRYKMCGNGVVSKVVEFVSQVLPNNP